ncbi:MAG: diadenylate cyclase CdaA, partial [Clostridia bacterium]|nr:diadenylate cyclase CdaA [Clostridia bacterium]
MFSQFFQYSGVWSILINVLDIVIVAYVIYRLLLIIRGTRAVQLIKGIIILFIAATIADFLGFKTIQWILSQLWAVIFVALAVIFQPELRRALEQIGRGGFFSRSLFVAPEVDMGRTIDAVVKASTSGARTRTGMLMVIENETGLNNYIETGIQLDALVSEEFLVNIFVNKTPLHDGAAIIRGNRVVAAACFLPLTDNPYISMALGTRHRAAIGLSEVSDAIIVVVSEETGSISVSKDGKLIRSLDEK